MKPIIKKTFLRAIRLERDLVSNLEQYPFSIPAERHLRRLEFHPAVTFLHWRKRHRQIYAAGSNCCQTRVQSQLVIATHSPTLLAYPNARIYQFSQDGISEVEYTETEHYQITKDFLNYLRRGTAWPERIPCPTGRIIGLEIEAEALSR
jgi:predicted ATPase